MVQYYYYYAYRSRGRLHEKRLDMASGGRKKFIVLAYTDDLAMVAKTKK